MKTLTLLLLPLFIFVSYGSKSPFTGKILYKYSFTDLQGNDVSEQLAPYYKDGQEYFIGTDSYKSHYQQKLTQLYNAETNSYFYIVNDSTAKRIDGATPTSDKFIVTHLKETGLVAGYKCKAVKIETDDAITVYYYSPKIRTAKQVFINHELGEWNKYLEATDGALALQFIMTKKQEGFIWTSTATEVTGLQFTASDFILPATFTQR